MKNNLPPAMNRTPSDPTPKYYRLQTLLREQIETGKWGPGQTVPTEEELTRAHGLSLNTVRKAITNLVSEGYLYRMQGKGTFVSGNTIRREYLRSYPMVRDFGKDEAALRIGFLSLGRTEGDPSIRRGLRIRNHQDLYELKRAFYCHERPFVFSLSYLPTGIFKDLEKISRGRIERVSLYALLEEIYGVTTLVQKELFSASQAGGEVREVLGVEEGHPLLSIHMIALTYKKRPYEYRISYCRTDTHRVYREK
jgi:GntR family transcriptional regulator